MLHLYPARALLEGAEVEIFKLLYFGATPNQWAEWLRAPLEHAAARGNLDLVERLLKAGANGSAGWRGCRGRTLLDAAALGGNEHVVCALLRAGCVPDLNVVSVSSGRSALHSSVVCGYAAVAQQLMLAGAEVNHEDAYDRCGPLHVAAVGGHREIVRDLLLTGACPNARDFYGRTPLHYAAHSGHSSIVSTLLGSASTDKNALDNTRKSPLVLATENGHIAVVRILLMGGADINAHTNHESQQSVSLLNAAATGGFSEIAEAIIEHGGKVNAESPGLGFSPLHYAAEVDSDRVVHVLLDSGARIGAIGRVGGTPLHMAALHNSTNAMHALLQRGADVDAAGSRGCTPLLWICTHQRPGLEAAVDLLLRWGASETAVDKTGKTPIEVLDSRSANRRCSADEVGRVRLLLLRAPIDRTWRRRCWLVMLRARMDREVTAQSSFRGNTSGNTAGRGNLRVGSAGEAGGSTSMAKAADLRGGRARKGGQEVAGVTVTGRAVEGTGFGGLVAAVVKLKSHEMFRTVVCYL